MQIFIISYLFYSYLTNVTIMFINIIRFYVTYAHVQKAA